MKLLELLCEELPKRGGWPESAVAAVQNNKDGMYRVVFVGEGYNISPRKYYSNRVGWTIQFEGGTWGSVKANIDFHPDTLASDHATRIVTREEYEAAVTPRVIPRRSDVLASLVGNLKQWPTKITDDLPHFIGWAWMYQPSSKGVLSTIVLHNESESTNIVKIEWAHQRHTQWVQPTPHGSGDPILGMVLADLTNRALVGKEKYGEPLKAHNGRNALQDAYEEALDMCMYLRQALEEQRNA
ncbi:MAG: hypothetical protein ACRC8W_13500 [Plesiomonas shigelloides]